MIWTTLVSALINKIWQLFWTFWHCRNLDKNNICTLSVKIRFNCNHYETALKSAPKTCFSASKAPAYRFIILRQCTCFVNMYLHLKWLDPIMLSYFLKVKKISLENIILDWLVNLKYVAAQWVNWLAPFNSVSKM